jgi:CheY-like chemotaxis protein
MVIQADLLEVSDLINDREFLRRLSSMRVLVADDSRNMVKTIENMLISICQFKRKSESVFRAYSGKDALDILTRQAHLPGQHIDILLLDWNMPTMAGIDVLRAIRGANEEIIRNTPVIMITGESLDRDVNGAIWEGVDNYLLKPFLLGDLRTRMNPLLRFTWSGHVPQRAKNRRGEIRYSGHRLKMQVRLEFADGTLKIGDIVNISHHGLRVEVSTPKTLEVKSVCFKNHGAESDEFPNRLPCLSFLPEVKAEQERVGISIFLNAGFPTKQVEEAWLVWLDTAIKKDREYRDSLI